MLLNGHLDTVSIAGMKDPLVPVLKEGRVYGRGAQDMKGGLAAAVAALLALSRHREDWKGEVVLAAVADEEDLSLGTTWFLEHWPRDRPFDFALGAGTDRSSGGHRPQGVCLGRSHDLREGSPRQPAGRRPGCHSA